MKRWLPGHVTRVGRRRRIIALSPPVVLTLGFLGLILLGAVLLKLPAASRHSIGWLEALFTSTSAVTVTGLTVVETGTAFTRFGEIVLLGLIQLGGLGFMTFAVLVMRLLGQRLRLSHQVLLRDDLNQTALGDLMRLVRIVIVVVLIFEGLGTLLLAGVWVPRYGWAEGFFQALFHAVSAFNNAGFTLFAGNLSQWVGHPLVNIVVSLLFIVGGLGFSVLSELHQQWRFRRLSLHSKLMLVGTVGLNVGAFGAFAMLEWRNPGTLGGLDTFGERLWAAWFQAATPRTAGFNTLDIGELRESTAFVMIGLMFIGGGSTSTAGGVKVTTFMILLLATGAYLRHRPVPNAFGRSVSSEDVLKVLALTFISLVVVATGTFVLSVSQQLAFLDLAFEAVSAFSTAGLTRDVTTRLDGFGELVVMLLMFIGRMGPLTFGFLLATSHTDRYRYPPQTIYLG
ncbi:MAG: Ktr system potassium transporter B [Nitrococcus mobilis]|nr:Ktr system potassium transporter B [Nitrococcus mobilis]